jgi:hypothetical protein
MTDLAAALANTDLGEHEGDKVLSVGIEIPGAAGGLREALKIDPVVKHRGDEVLVLIRAKVGKLRYDPVKDTNGVRRVHVLDVDSAALVEGEVFEHALDEMAERIKLAVEAAQGIKRLDFGGDEEKAAKAAEHEDGQHASGLVAGCPLCDEEQDATDDEAAQG